MIVSMTLKIIQVINGNEKDIFLQRTLISPGRLQANGSFPLKMNRSPTAARTPPAIIIIIPMLFMNMPARRGEWPFYISISA